MCFDFSYMMRLTLSKYPIRRNVTILVLLAGAIVWFDQWTKSWAENNLATPYHLLPVRTTETVPIEKALQSSLGMSKSEARGMVRSVPSHVIRVSGKPFVNADSPPSGVLAPARQNGQILYIFSRGPNGPARYVFVPSDSIHRTMLDAVVAKLPDLNRARARGLFERGLVYLGTPYGLGVEHLKQAPSRSGFYRLSGAPPVHPRGFSLPRDDFDTLGAALAQELKKDAKTIEEWVRTGRLKVYYTPVEEMEEGQNLEAGEFALIKVRSIPVISGFMRFNYAENRGAAWSFMADASHVFRFWFFTVITLIAIVVLVALILLQPLDKRLTTYAYASILGGAIGNLIDRIRVNYVVDFIDMYIGQSHWPTYNIADVGISCGVGMLILDMILVWRDERAEAA
ncbi:MAG: signal peptidase II [Myxococcales bacterium]|nr:signal peptidase II [Myxococcales bacterium]